MKLKDEKNSRVSFEGFTFCSECKSGFNGKKVCFYGGDIHTRRLKGCDQGNLIEGLEELPQFFRRYN
jgi:hypothetical protein